MSDVKSSGPATTDNTAIQNSSTSGVLLGTGTGGTGVGIGDGATGVGGTGFNSQVLDQFTDQVLNQTGSAVSTNQATDNIEANKTINFGNLFS